MAIVKVGKIVYSVHSPVNGLTERHMKTIVVYHVHQICGMNYQVRTDRI